MKHVGRVGVLAVTLGVGVAVASTPSVAWASPDSQTSAADSAPSAPSSKDSKPARRPALRARNAERGTDTEAAPGAVAKNIRSAIEGLTAPKAPARGQFQVRMPRTSRAHVAPPDRKRVPAPEAAALTTGPDTAVAPRSAISGRAEVESSLMQAIEPVSATPEASTMKTTRVSTPKVSIRLTRAPVVQAPPPAHALVASLLTALGYNPTATGPSAPANPNPVLVGIWGLYRRLESVFDNQAPTAGTPAVTSSSLVAGQTVYSGRLGFSDFNDDPLSFDVVAQPEHGTVSVNPDGTFTYTQTDPDFRGTDTFTVAATDNALFGAHTTNASYALTVGAAVTQIALPAGSTPVGTVVLGNGVAYQTVQYTDNSVGVIAINPDGTTHAVTSSPLSGTPAGLAVNPVTGAVYQVVYHDDGDGAVTSSLHTFDPVTYSTTTQVLDGTASAPVIDSRTGVAYVSTTKGLSSDATTTVYIVKPDGSTTQSAAVVGSVRNTLGAGGLVIDSRSGATYLTTTAAGVTSIWTVGSDGQINRLGQPLSGFASGGVVVDADGNLYQSIDDVDNHTNYVALLDKSTGNVITRWQLSANPEGGVVITPSGVYQTVWAFNYGEYPDIDGWVSIVEILNPDGAAAWSAEGIPGTPIGGPWVNPTTGSLLQITNSAYSSSHATWSVTLVNPSGTDTVIALNGGAAEIAGSADPATGRIYQTTRASVQSGTDQLGNPVYHDVYQVTAIDPDGSHHVVLSGLPENYVFGTTVDSGSGDVYISTQGGVWVISGDATEGENTLPDSTSIAV